MKEFSQLGLKKKSRQFVGDKIKISKLVQKEIIVHDFKVGPSKFEGAGKCLSMQIEFEQEKRVVFTRGSVLIDLLEQADKNDFPFKAIIVREDENGPYEFKQ